MSERNGDQPDGWELVTIADVVVPKVEQGAPSTDFTYIDIGSINNKTKEIDSAKDLIAGSNVPSRAQQHVQAGDILVSMTRPNLNAVAKVPMELDGAICSSGFDVLRLIEVEPDWLFLIVKSRPFVEVMTSLVQGALYPAVRPADVRAYKFALPPMAEQRRIVAKIVSLQERSRRAREALAEVGLLLEQFRQSVLAAAFRGDLTADWRAAHPKVERASELLHRIRAERLSRWEQAELAKYEAQSKKPPKNWKDRYKEPEPIDDTELPELPEGWGYTRIDALLSQTRPGIKTGPFGSLLKKHEHRQQGIPVLGIENIGRMRFVEGGKIYITEEKADYLSDYDVYPNDILISRSGTVGEVCIVPESVCTARFSTNIIRVVLAEGGMSPTFFGYVITGSPFVKRQISEACAGSTRDFLNKTILESLVFPLPPIAEQDVIIGRLERLFNWTSTILDVATGCMEALDQLDQAILAKAFRGELVRQDPSDELASVLLERIRAQPKRQAKAQKQTSKSHQTSKLGKNSSRLEPQQLTLAEVLRTAD